MKFLFDKDTWQEIYGAIRKNKGRTAITIIGVMWGIFLLVTLLGAARGVENGFNRMFGSFATNSVFVWGRATSMPFKGFQEGKRVRLTLSDIDAIEQELPEIMMTVPRISTNSLCSNGFKAGTFEVFGDYSELDMVQKKNLDYGRFLNKTDILEKRKVCVLEEETYKQLFDKDEYPIGTMIKINDTNFKIVGIYKKGAVSIDSAEIHIGYSIFQQLYNRGENIDYMFVTANEGTDIVQLEADIKLLLKNIHKVHPEDDRALGSFNMGKEMEKVTSFLTGMQFMTWFIGIATLIAGVFAIGNILLITVKERTKEIGVRRALGATPRDIRNQIVMESVFLTSIAGMLGIIFGGIVLVIIDSLVGDEPDAFMVNPTINIPIVLIALVTLVTLGTLIGLIPAGIATRIKPIEALREE